MQQMEEWVVVPRTNAALPLWTATSGLWLGEVLEWVLLPRGNKRFHFYLFTLLRRIYWKFIMLYIMLNPCNKFQSVPILYYVNHRRTVDMLNSRPRPKAETSYLAYQPPFYASYDISSGCDVTAHHYRENSPVSTTVRQRPFCRLICHTSNLPTILKLLWWCHNHVICII